MEKLSLEELKKVELDILIWFADICEQEKLNYTLSYGTLLGAVRHKGFIPWDDQIMKSLLNIAIHMKLIIN